MDQPYPSPVREKTNLRCQYSLPGKRYDCRQFGHYRLGVKRYCAPHYDAKWKALNPVFGTQHDWHIHINHLTGESWPYETCKRCGSIRLHEGLAQDPCRGFQAKIVLW